MIGCENLCLICRKSAKFFVHDKFTHFSRLIFLNARFLFKLVAQICTYVAEAFFPPQLIFCYWFHKYAIISPKIFKFSIFCHWLMKNGTFLQCYLFIYFKCVICYLHVQLLCLKSVKFTSLCDLFSEFFRE